MKKIAVVIPVYNAQNTLAQLAEGLVSVLGKGRYAYEIILVDDGSKDNSWNEIIRLRSQYPQNVKGVRLSRNYGQHMAIVCGLNLAEAEAVITMDDDLQHPPAEIEKLLQRWEETGADVVYGLYESAATHGRARAAASKLAKKSAEMFGGNDVGVASPFRLLSRKMVQKLLLHPQQFVYIDDLVYWHSPHVTGVQVQHAPRKSGRSNYNWYRLLKLYFTISINYTVRPLKLMIWGGIALSAFSFSLGMYFILKKIFYNISVEGYTSLMVAVLFSASLMLICFGILGQYMYRIFQQQSGKPPFTIKQII